MRTQKNILKRAAMRAAQSSDTTYCNISLPERIYFRDISHDNGHLDACDGIRYRITPGLRGLKVESALTDSTMSVQALTWEIVFEGSLNETLKFFGEYNLPELTFDHLKGGEW